MVAKNRKNKAISSLRGVYCAIEIEATINTEGHPSMTSTSSEKCPKRKKISPKAALGRAN